MNAAQKITAISDTSLYSTTPLCYSCNHGYTDYESDNLTTCPYTATPTPNSNYMTPSSSCYLSSYFSNSKQNQQNKFHLDFSNGFPIISDIGTPDIDPSDSKQTESKTKIMLTPKTPQNTQNNIISNNDDINAHNTGSHEISPNNLKIRIPKAINNTKSNIQKSNTLKSVNIKHKIKKEYYAEDTTLLLHGYQKERYIVNALQGHVMSATYIINRNFKLIIKTSNKKLYNEHVSIQNDGKIYKIQEDIVKEAKLMRRFISTSNIYSIPSSLIKYYDFFQDEENYYLVMEYGGTNLFEFIVKCHDLINSNKLSLNEWRKHCKFMFAQMILCINWMHKIQNCCHLDISLENMLICKDVKITENEQEFSNNTCYIKIIDFGLTEYFDPISNPYFFCNKFVGKQTYKAPKVYHHKGPFRGNKADVWSLGVVLFIMIIGAPPYIKPIDNDLLFKYIKNNQLFQILESWNKTHYVTNNLFDLLTKMLCCDESKRIDIDDIMQHPWINMYFPNQNNYQ